MIPEPDWTEAECRRLGCPTYIFFYEDRHPRQSKSYVEAKEAARAICFSCPIRQICAEYALASNQPGGMWGGLTFGDRKKERRRRYRLAVLSLEPARTLEDPTRAGHYDDHEQSGRSRR